MAVMLSLHALVARYPEEDWWYFFLSNALLTLGPSLILTPIRLDKNSGVCGTTG
jgi:hypothetical protein